MKMPAQPATASAFCDLLSGHLQTPAMAGAGPSAEHHRFCSRRRVLPLRMTLAAVTRTGQAPFDRAAPAAAR